MPSILDALQPLFEDETLPAYAPPSARGQPLLTSEVLNVLEGPMGTSFRSPAQQPKAFGKALKYGYVEDDDGNKTYLTEGERIAAAQRFTEQVSAGSQIGDQQQLWDWARKLPGFKQAWGIVGPTMAMNSMTRIQAGQATTDDYVVLGNYLREADEETRRTTLQKFRDIAIELPDYMTAFFLSGGVAQGAKKATEGAISSAVKKNIATRLAGTTAGAVARTASPAMIPQVARSVAQYAAPTPTGIVEQPLQPGDSMPVALGKGFASTAIENLTEQAGEVIGPMLDDIARAVAPRVVQALPKFSGDTSRAIRETLREAGFQGIPAEYLEERLSEVLHGVTGLGGFGVTGNVAEAGLEAYRGDLGKAKELLAEAGKQSAAEAMAFSLIPGGQVAIGLAERAQAVPRQRAAMEAWKRGLSATQSVEAAGLPAKEREALSQQIPTQQQVVPSAVDVPSLIPTSSMAAQTPTESQRPTRVDAELQYASPATAVEWALTNSDKAQQLIRGRRYNASAFTAAGLPELKGEPGDVDKRRSWFRVVEDYVNAPDDVKRAYHGYATESLPTEIGEEWSLVPPGGPIPEEPEIETHTGPVGTFVRRRAAIKEELENAQQKPQAEEVYADGGTRPRPPLGPIQGSEGAPEISSAGIRESGPESQIIGEEGIAPETTPVEQQVVKPPRKGLKKPQAGIVEVVAESPGARRQRSKDIVAAETFREGDRVSWTSHEGEPLTGTVRFGDKDSGTYSVDVDQISTVSGVPIGRIEFPLAVRLSRIDQPAKPSSAVPALPSQAQPTSKVSQASPIVSESPQIQQPTQPESISQPKAPPVPTFPATTKIEPSSDALLARRVADMLNSGETFDAKEFFTVADEAYGGTRAEGKYGPSDAYDALELGVNQHIYELPPEKYHPANVDDKEKAKSTLLALDNLVRSSIPSQTNRSGEKDAFQQFSTPPAYAYFVNWLARPDPSDVVLEPSAGTGSIAIHATKTGAQVYGNEYSQRRADLLRQLPLAGVTTEDAEQIHNILKDKMPTPTVVVMNPPFSHAAQRMGLKKIQGTDTKHIDAALNLMADNGRLVAIIGAGLHGPSRQFQNWLANVPYDVKANVEIGRDVYKGYGTTFPTRLLVIDKTARKSTPVKGKADTIEQAVDMLEGIRNERPISQPKSVEPSSPATSRKPAGGRQPAVPLQPAAGGMDLGERTPIDTGPMGEVRPTTPGQRAPSVPVGSQPSAATPAQPGKERENEPGGAQPSQPPREQQPEGVRGDTGRESVREPAFGPASAPASRIELEQPVAKQKRGKGERQELTESVYEPYRPSKFRAKRSKQHPASIVESAAMSAIDPPDVSYSPNLPNKVVTNGLLSELQLEAIAYAGQAHEQEIQVGENKFRKGFMIGDGTGVGKGREISGVILDNWTQGRHKAVWVSLNDKLFDDAKRDWTGIGQDPKTLFLQSKIASGAPIETREGILFTTYASLWRMESDAAKKQGLTKSRLQQIIDWLGPDFDGVIAFDEAHKMGSALEVEGGRGRKALSKVAEAGLELQKQLPNARVLYVSATSATEVYNLAYAERLGLWGRGTPFANKEDFVNEIASGGVAAMEKVAADMKAMGVYIARNISFNDGTEKGRVEYERIEHALTPQQRSSWDKMADAWGIVLQNMTKALALTEADGQAKGAAQSAFWGANQRFWNQVLTAMQTPAMMNAVERDLQSDVSIVIQLTNTNEAAQERALGKLEEGQSLEEIDISPRQMLMEYIEHSFPTQQFEEYTDENGNIRTKPVVDSQGNPVHNQQAIAMRERLLDELGSLEVGNRSAIDMILDRFGTKMVAEVTGRSRRIVRDETSGKLVSESRGKSARKADIVAFQDGRKRILVFSEAGGTGASYHADRSGKNQQKRHHYLLQAGWRADAAIQGLGRTHRSNQAQAPKYFLVHTDIKGQKRFISTIARRLSQLGALTKGLRQAGESGVFSAADNLESVEARDALQQFYRDLMSGAIEGVTVDSFETVTGLKLRDRNGNMAVQLPPITQFLNRVLNLPFEQQNNVFEQFESRLKTMVETAVQNGTLDQGLETVKADKITKISEKVVYRHSSGAETKHVVAKLANKTKPITWEQLQQRTHPERYVKSLRSGRTMAVELTNVSEADEHTGAISRKVKLYLPTGHHYSTLSAIENPKFYEPVKDEALAKEAWEEQVSEVPDFAEREEHLLTGVLLPIWDRIQGRPRVVRMLTDDGEQLLGRIIDPESVSSTLRGLGVEGEAPKVSASEVVNNLKAGRNEYVLGNDWRLKRSLVQHEPRIEIVGPSFEHNGELKSIGIFWERVGFKTRYFVPVGENQEEIINQLITDHPVRDIISIRSEGPETVPTFGTFGGGEMIPNRRRQDTLNIPSEALSHRPEVEERLQAAFGAKSVSWRDQVRENIAWFSRGLESQGWLPAKSTKLAPARDLLRTLQGAQKRAMDRANRDIAALLDDLTPREYHVFNRVVLLQNLADAIDNNEPARFGYGVNKDGEFDAQRAREEVSTDLERVGDLADSTPKIKKALDRRETIVSDLVGELIDYGLLPERIRENPKAYYHQQVLTYQQSERFARLVKPLKRKKGFQRERLKDIDSLGEKYDYNTNYVEAEVSWMTDAYTSLELEQVLQELQKQYDIKGQLKKQAEKTNFETLVGGPNNVDRINELRDLIAESREVGGEDSDERLQRKKWIEELTELDPTYPFRRRIAQLMEAVAKDHPELGQLDENEAFTDNEFEQANKAFWGTLRRISTDPKDPAYTAAKGVFKAISDRRALIQDSLGNQYVDWRRLANNRDDYTIWTPTPGNVFYRAWTVPERVLEQFAAGLIDQYQLTQDELRQVFAMGGPRGEMVLPAEIVNQLETLTKSKPRQIVESILDGITSTWKRVILLSPWRIVGYETRNFLGDTDPVVAVMPVLDVATYGQRAFRELKLFYRKENFPVSERLAMARDLEVIDSGMTARELSGISELPAFEHLFEKLPDRRPSKYNPLAVIKTYYKGAETLSRVREGTLRYAVFNWLLDQKEKTGKWPTYGASRGPSVDAVGNALGDARAAAKIARELVGDYGDVSQFGVWLSRTAIPFWRFQELNLRRYPRLLINAVAEGRNAQAGRLAAGRAAVLTTRIAWMWALTWLLNRLMFPDEEEQLPEYYQNNPHITLGRRPDGSVRVLNNVGSLGDFLEWFGGNDLPMNLERWEKEQVSGGFVTREMAKAFAGKLYGMMTPLVKTPIETMAGVSLFPDVTRPRPIRRDEEIANTVGLRDEWKWVKGKILGDGSSVRPHSWERWVGLSVVQPQKVMLDKIHSARMRFLEKKGQRVDQTLKLSRWQNVKEAVQNEDYEAFKNARRKILQDKSFDGNYAKAFDAYLQFLDKLDPIEYRLNERLEQEFVNDYLDDQERKELHIARDYARSLSDQLIIWWEVASREEDPERDRAEYLRELGKKRMQAIKTVMGQGMPKWNPGEKISDFQIRVRQFGDQGNKAKRFLTKTAEARKKSLSQVE